MHEVKSDWYFSPYTSRRRHAKNNVSEKIKVKSGISNISIRKDVTEIYECNNKLNKPTFSFIWQQYYQKKNIHKKLHKEKNYIKKYIKISGLHGETAFKSQNS